MSDTVSARQLSNYVSAITVLLLFLLIPNDVTKILKN